METTSDRILGELPDLFRMKDGTRMSGKSQQPRRQLEILEETVPLLHGLSRCLRRYTAP